MPEVLSKVRSLFVRGLAVLAVVLAYAATGIGTQVASIAGISSLALLTTTQPADAGYRYRRRYRRRRYRRWGY
jgi:hypothetical protein